MSCSYDNELRASLEAAPIASSVSEAKAWRGEVRLQYKSQEEFEQLAVAFTMMKEWRDGVPRAAYHGVVRCSWLSTVLRAIHPSIFTHHWWLVQPTIWMLVGSCHLLASPGLCMMCIRCSLCKSAS